MIADPERETIVSHLHAEPEDDVQHAIDAARAELRDALSPFSSRPTEVAAHAVVGHLARAYTLMTDRARITGCYGGTVFDATARLAIATKYCAEHIQEWITSRARLQQEFGRAIDVASTAATVVTARVAQTLSNREDETHRGR